MTATSGNPLFAFTLRDDLPLPTDCLPHEIDLHGTFAEVRVGGERYTPHALHPHTK